MSEQVYCIPAAEALKIIGLNTGFIPTAVVDELAGSTLEQPKDGMDILQNIPGQFIPRQDCEEDPHWLQFIPYCLLLETPGNLKRKTMDRKAYSIYTYLRNRHAGEHRLHSQRSLGIGGHINPCDLGDLTDPLRPNAMILSAAVREIEEEVGLRPVVQSSQLQPLGIIYDPSTAVGSVHLGLVFKVVMRNYQEVTRRDIAASENCFYNCDSLMGRKEEFENWSQILLPLVDRW